MVTTLFATAAGVTAFIYLMDRLGIELDKIFSRFDQGDRIERRLDEIQSSLKSVELAFILISIAILFLVYMEVKVLVK